MEHIYFMLSVSNLSENALFSFALKIPIYSDKIVSFSH